MSDKLWSACPAFSASALLLLSPTSFQLLSHSLQPVILSVSAALTRRKRRDFFFLTPRTASTLSPVGIHYSLNSFSALLATLKSLSFDIPLQLCTVFFIHWQSESIKVDVIHGSLSKNAWTKIYFIFHRMLSTVSGLLTREYEGCF